MYDEVDGGYRGYLQFYLSDDKEPFEAMGGLVHDCYVVVSEKKMGRNWLHIYFASNEIRDKYTLTHYGGAAVIKIGEGLKFVGLQKKWSKMITDEMKKDLALDALSDKGYKTSTIYPLDEYNTTGIEVECGKCHHKFTVQKNSRFCLELVTYVVQTGMSSEKTCSVFGGSRRCPICKTPVKFACEWILIQTMRDAVYYLSACSMYVSRIFCFNYFFEQMKKASSEH